VINDSITDIFAITGTITDALWNHLLIIFVPLLMEFPHSRMRITDQIRISNATLLTKFATVMPRITDLFNSVMAQIINYQKMRLFQKSKNYV
jgi:hypothetical protein